MSSTPPDEAIAIVGSGRVGRALGRALTARGARIVAVASRDPAHAESAASFIGGGAQAVSIERIASLATRIILAVTDGHIAGVAAALAQSQLAGAVVVHTSGAAGLAPLRPLRDAGASCGVMHPLQTIGDGPQAAAFDGIAFAVLGDPAAVAWATAVVRSLDAWPLHPREGDLASYHAAAVMAGNSMWAVIEAAVVLMTDAGIPAADARAALGPLARKSLEQALMPGAGEALTGPVARADLETLRRHFTALEGAPPHLRVLYHAVAQYLVDIASRHRLTAEETAALRALLAGLK